MRPHANFPSPLDIPRCLRGLRLCWLLARAPHALSDPASRYFSALPLAHSAVTGLRPLSFALIQDACARQFRRHDDRAPPTWTGTPRRRQGPPADAARSTFSKSRPQPKDDVMGISAYISHLLDKKARSPTPRAEGVSAFLCNLLDEHGVKPVKVLKQAGLRHDTPADWQTGDAVHALYMASQQFMPQTLHTDSEGASDNDDSDERPSLVDSDSDT